VSETGPEGFPLPTESDHPVPPWDHGSGERSSWAEEPAFTPPPTSPTPAAPPAGRPVPPWEHEPAGAPPQPPLSPSFGAASGPPASPPPVPPAVPPSPSLPPSAPQRAGLRSLIEWVVIIAVALVGAFVIRTVLFQAFFIPSASMDPTLKVHDRILVNKLSYDMHPIHRGDIVVFKRAPTMVGTEGTIKDLVKRVIGLPGETISTGPDGRIRINGEPLDETYLVPGIQPGPAISRGPNCMPTGPQNACTIPPGSYFVMGDNRDNSSDSRVFGPIPKHLIVGRAFVIIWPLQDIGLL
jgi:signal peptidase I